jgi:hypothetical protein
LDYNKPIWIESKLIVEILSITANLAPANVTNPVVIPIGIRAGLASNRWTKRK